MIPVSTSNQEEEGVSLNGLNRYTFTTPFRNETNTNTNMNSTNSNINASTKSSSDYKKYRNMATSNLSSLYPLPYASPTLFKSKAVRTVSSTNFNSKYLPDTTSSTLRIPLSSEYWRSRLKRRDIISSLQPLSLLE